MRETTIALVIAGAVLLSCAATPIVIRFRARVRGLDAEASVEARTLFGLLKREFAVWPPAETRGAPVVERPRGGGMWGVAGEAGVFRTASRVLSVCACRRFRLEAVIGTGEAASTGITAGLAWEAVGMLSPVVMGSLRRWRCRPVVVIAPWFAESRFDVDFDCILQIPLGHAIVAVLGAALKSVRRGTGLGRTPDTGPHEDSHGEPQRYG